MGRTLTTIYLENQFKKYNTLYFNGVLPIPMFTIKHSRKTLGTYYYRSIGYVKHRIAVTDCFDIEDKEIDNILIHEMIHYYIKYMGIKDNSSHGREFKAQCARINKYGWNLSRTTNISSWKLKDKYVKKDKEHNVIQHLVCIYKTKGYQYFIYTLNEKYKKLHEDDFKKNNMKYKMFYTTNETFNTLPKCRTRRCGRFVENENDTRFGKYIKYFENENN